MENFIIFFDIFFNHLGAILTLFTLFFSHDFCTDSHYVPHPT